MPYLPREEILLFLKLGFDICTIKLDKALRISLLSILIVTPESSLTDLFRFEVFSKGNTVNGSTKVGPISLF